MIGPPKITTNIYITHVLYLYKENIDMANLSGVPGSHSPCTGTYKWDGHFSSFLKKYNQNKKKYVAKRCKNRDLPLDLIMFI